MRPKIVILILVAAFGLLGLIVLVKGVASKNVGGSGGQTVAVQPPPDSHPGGTNVQSLPAAGSSNAVAVSEELRVAVIEKEVEQIRDLQGQADGTNNLQIITAIIDKLAQPEAEVRGAALDALRQLNDTNAVPGLEKAAASITDPREKVAVLDTIDYIKMPSVTDNAAPELATNSTPHHDRTSVSTNIQFNPAFLKGNKNIRVKNNSQQSIPPNSPGTQPQ